MSNTVQQPQVPPGQSPAQETPADTPIQPQQTQLICTCKNPDGTPVKFRTGFCPVCDVQGTPESSSLPGYNIDSDTVILTDEYLYSDKIFKWAGHPFVCPKCGWIILPDFPNCVNCKSKVVMQSHFLNNYIENELKKRNGK